MMEPQDWIPARRRRILLAGFLDFCLLTASFGLLEHFAYVLDPEIGEFPLYARILAFLVIEYLLLERLRWSPGLHLLSIRFLDLRDDMAAAAGLPFTIWKKLTSVSVNAWVKTHESWFTLLMGVWMVNEGSKSLVRWTLWVPPYPEFGFEMSASVSAALSVARGAIEIFLAWAIFRLRFIALPVGVAHFTIALVSMWMSWHLWDSWVVEYVTRRRTFQGLPVRQSEIEQMQAITPEWQLAFLGVAIVLFLFLTVPIVRSRRAPQIEQPDTGG